MVWYKRGIKRDQYYTKIPRRHSFNDKHASGIVLKQYLKYFQILKWNDMFLITCSSHAEIFVAYYILGAIEFSRYKIMLVSWVEESVFYCQTQNRGNTVA